MNLPAISLFEVPSLHTARFFSAGLEGRSKKFRPEAFGRILAVILEFWGGRSDDRFEGWFGPSMTVDELGQKQFPEFCTTRLDEQKILLFDVIKRNKIQLFSSPPAPKETTKDKMKIASLKSNCSLFSRLYISCQVREGDLDSFFTHENQSYPPSLSQYGTLRSGNKSDLLFCLERLCPAKAEKPSVDVLLLDGAAIVNMLKPTGACKTFAEYSQFVFIPYVTREIESVKRVDVTV